MGVISEVNVFCPKLCRELIIVHLNVHIIPSGCGLFLTLSKRNERFIVDQLFALVELGQNLKACSVCYLALRVVSGAEYAKDATDLPSVSREEKREMRRGRRG